MISYLSTDVDSIVDDVTSFEGLNVSFESGNLEQAAKKKKAREKACLQLEKVIIGPQGALTRFVNFMNKEDAERTINMLNGYGYDNLIVRVEWATPRSN
ncbi:hypothetical protein GIB67_001589 [Kingdonia uniflora]|uniref:RRM domain-containing protein n=1 Tax=Kingdonia uniflora TaxID=39325 RepID=A0A7J7L0L8_9MAGN|nr:hypothetical protein GIB67_001589 [Kingdonia uniflora]